MRACKWGWSTGWGRTTGWGWTTGWCSVGCSSHGFFTLVTKAKFGVITGRNTGHFAIEEDTCPTWTTSRISEFLGRRNLSILLFTTVLLRVLFVGSCLCSAGLNQNTNFNGHVPCFQSDQKYRSRSMRIARAGQCLQRLAPDLIRCQRTTGTASWRSRAVGYRRRAIYVLLYERNEGFIGPREKNPSSRQYLRAQDSPPFYVAVSLR